MRLAPVLLATLSILCSFALISVLRARNQLINRLRLMVPGTGLQEGNPEFKQRRRGRISKTARRQSDSELPDLIDLACIAVLTGHTLQQAIERVVSRANGRVAEELAIFQRNVELGRTVSSELSALCERLPTPAIREFANKISIAMSRGTPLAESLTSLSAALRVRRANDLLARAGANETKMLIPLVSLVLPTTVLFALYPSVLVLNLGFS
ncbi:MAG: type II secretion system F family protein [Rhodoluna sp.]|jgi:tight adherence protein C|nr:type II secretion system F family protein [Rhodoluna sp.]